MIYKNFKEFSLKSFIFECNKLSNCIQIKEENNNLKIYSEFLDKEVNFNLNNSIKNKIRVIDNYMHKYNFMQKLYLNFSDTDFDFNEFLNIIFVELLEKYMHIYLCDIERIQNLNEFENFVNDLNISFVNLDLNFNELIEKFNYCYINHILLEKIDYKIIRSLKIQVCKSKFAEIDYIQNCLYLNEVYEIDSYILENLIENAIEYLEYDLHIYHQNKLLFISDIDNIFFNLYNIKNIIESKDCYKEYDNINLQLFNIDLHK